MMLLYFSFTADAVRVMMDGDFSGDFDGPLRRLVVIAGERDLEELGVLLDDFVLNLVGVALPPSSVALMCAYGS